MLGNQFDPSTLTVFFFLWPSASAKRAIIAPHLVKSILYGIWVFRNKATFYNVSYDHRAIIKFVVGDLLCGVLFAHAQYPSNSIFYHIRGNEIDYNVLVISSR